MSPTRAGERPRLALDLSLEEARALLAELGQPAYRAAQLWRWLYRELAGDFEQMTDLPAGLRHDLAAAVDLSAGWPAASRASADGLTRKVLLALPGEATVETVLMLYPERATVCVSTQVGCALACSFCATGQMGLLRNLSAGEIVAQVLHFARELRREDLRVTNVVFMGMGEPLANYSELWRAIRLLHDPRGFNLGARHMTVSTAGLVPGIRRFAAEPLPVGLAISLHAPDDELRSRLMPINRRYPLDELLGAAREYTERTGRRVTFEYALMCDINDAPAQARALAARLRGLLGHVNLIPMNPVAGTGLRASSPARVRAFQAELAERGIPVSVRQNRGVEIDAACGQLQARAGRDPTPWLSPISTASPA